LRTSNKQEDRDRLRHRLKELKQKAKASGKELVRDSIINLTFKAYK